MTKTIRQVVVMALVALGAAGASGCEGLNACGNLQDKVEGCGFDGEHRRLSAPYDLGSQDQCSASQSCAASCVFSLSCEDMTAAVNLGYRITDPNAVPSVVSPSLRARQARCCIASCLNLPGGAGAPLPLFSREACDRAAINPE